MTPRNTKQLAAGERTRALTTQGRRFYTLALQIAQVRQTLKKWQENMGMFRQGYTEELLPLRAELTAARRQCVFALDELLGSPDWTRAQRDTLSKVVCNNAAELLYGQDDERLKAVYDKYAEGDFDTKREQMLSTVRNMMKIKFDLNAVDGEKIGVPVDVLAHVRRKRRSEMEPKKPEIGTKHLHQGGGASQQRRDEVSMQVAQAVLESFQNISKCLHPEHDDDCMQGDVKAVLRHKANQAYEANDLLTLLELQFEVEQIEAVCIEKLSDERLKMYNAILGDHLVQLRKEVLRVEVRFCTEFGLTPTRGMNPHNLCQLLEQNIRQLRANLNHQLHNMSMLVDSETTRQWLEQYNQSLRDEVPDFDTSVMTQSQHKHDPRNF